MVSITLLAGLCALFLGRRVFWLFVGIAGFTLGAEVAARLFRGEQFGPPQLLIALAGGAVGAVLAHRMQELMIGVIGAIAGSYLGAELLLTGMPYPGRMIWFAVFLGGLIGVVLARAFFDWTIIVVSSLVGAGLIVQAWGSGLEAIPGVVLMLAAVGIVAQACIGGRRR